MFWAFGRRRRPAAARNGKPDAARWRDDGGEVETAPSVRIGRRGTARMKDGMRASAGTESPRILGVEDAAG